MLCDRVVKVALVVDSLLWLPVSILSYVALSCGSIGETTRACRWGRVRESSIAGDASSTEGISARGWLYGGQVLGVLLSWPWPILQTRGVSGSVCLRHALRNTGVFPSVAMALPVSGSRSAGMLIIYRSCVCRTSGMDTSRMYGRITLIASLGRA